MCSSFFSRLIMHAALGCVIIDLQTFFVDVNDENIMFLSALSAELWHTPDPSTSGKLRSSDAPRVLALVLGGIA